MTAPPANKPVLRVLAGEREPIPPLWLMRQAGRYLPEYRAIREKAASFLDLCFDPNWRREITLQPVRRFGFDAAILFSDILVVPHALGQRVTFDEGEGPRLDALDGSMRQLTACAARSITESLEPVYETIGTGQAGSAAGSDAAGLLWCAVDAGDLHDCGLGTPDQLPARLFAYRFPEAFAKLIDLLVDASASYLVRQFEAGVDAVQIFDTWAGILPADEFRKWCIEPTARIVDSGAQAKFPARRSSAFLAVPEPSLALISMPSALMRWDSIGRSSLTLLAIEIQTRRPVQGNLDPLALLVGGDGARSVDRCYSGGVFARGPFIFNLGHGVLPETPIAHVERLVARVRNMRDAVTETATGRGRAWSQSADGDSMAG